MALCECPPECRNTRPLASNPPAPAVHITNPPASATHKKQVVWRQHVLMHVRTNIAPIVMAMQRSIPMMTPPITAVSVPVSCEASQGE